MTTEYSLNELSDKVYELDSKSEIFNSGLNVGEIKKFGGVNYQILKVEDNTSNGMQAMAVAPVKNGKVDTSEVVVAFAGTNPDDINDLKTDIINIGFSHKHSLEPFKKEAEVALKMAIPTTRFFMKPTAEAIPSQIITGEKFTDEIIKDYPDAVIKTTGHSLGGYIALYIASEYGLNSTVYNAPDPYNILSKEAKAWIKNNPYALVNYRVKADWIGRIWGDRTGAARLIDMGMSIWEDGLDPHALSVWEFVDGNVHIDNSAENRKVRLQVVEDNRHIKTDKLSFLAGKLKASGGISSNEEIFLDHASALIIIEYASESMNIGLESMIGTYQQAIIEAEENYEDTIRVCKLITTELSEFEIIDTLREGGVTEGNIVEEPKTYYKNKIHETYEIMAQFGKLTIKIVESIEKLLESDKNLANQIRQGV